ncbi:MAG: FliO/MopB family protein [Candidatus Saganbacteria bacterium]|nr:FliO/MopB family protein [Candidatus Saganbacteria bacterium]
MTSEPLVLQSSPIITAGYVMQVIFSLAIVVALIYVIARFLLPKLKVAGQGRLIRVLDRVMIEPQVSAYILKVGHQNWLIVSSNKNVEKIAELAELPEGRPPESAR